MLAFILSNITHFLILIFFLKAFKVYGYKVVLSTSAVYFIVMTYLSYIDIEYIHSVVYLSFAFLFLKYALSIFYFKNNSYIKFSTILDFGFCDIFTQDRIIKVFPKFRILGFPLIIMLLLVYAIYHRDDKPI